LRPSGGRIVFRSQDVTGNRPEQNARLGMARTFQNIRLFRDLPVIDNVAVGLHMRHGAGFWPTMLRIPAAARSEAAIRDRAREVLAVLDLGTVRAISWPTSPMAISARSSSRVRSRPSRLSCCSTNLLPA
jgi:ABC-type branched-subunit amino acid transport system ATPase component